MSQMDSTTFIQQARIAYAAITQHMLDHDLPVPTSTDIDITNQEIRLRVADEAAAQAWVTTLIVEDEHTEPFMGPVWNKTTWKVRLPDLGIGFELAGLRRPPFATHARSLTVVPA